MLETGIGRNYHEEPQRITDSFGPAFSAMIDHVRRLRPNPYVLILLAFAVLEALLGYRLWAQLTTQADKGTTDFVIDVTNAMVAPFRSLDVKTTRDTGLFEFATLAAMEAVLVGALALITGIFVIGNFTRISYRIATRGRRRSAAARMESDTLIPARPARVTASPEAIPAPSDE